MEDEKRENYYSFNILLLGNSKVGKTSIINAYCKNIYIENIIYQQLVLIINLRK